MSTHVADRLSAYMDGELTVADAAEVRQHLAACEPCTHELALLASVDRHLRERRADAPAGYFDSFSTRVRRRIEAKGRAPRPFRLPAWSWAVAAAVLLAVVVPRMLWDPPRVEAPSEPAPASAADPIELTDAPALAPSTPAAPATLPPAKAPTRTLPAPAATPRAAPGFAAAPAPSAAEGARRPEAKEMAELDAASAPEKSVDRMEERLAATAADEAAASRERLQKPPGGKGEAAKTLAPAPEAAGVVAEGRVVEKNDVRPESSALRGGPRADVQAEFMALRRRVAASVEEMRALREAWRSFVKRHPQTAAAAEARVLVVGLGMDIARETGSALDAEEAGRDGVEALAHGDPHQQQRVRSLLDQQPQ